LNPPLSKTEVLNNTESWRRHRTQLEHDHIWLGKEVLIIHRPVAGRCATVVSHDTQQRQNTRKAHPQPPRQSRYNLRLGALAQSCKRKFYNDFTVCKPSRYHYQLPQLLH